MPEAPRRPGWPPKKMGWRYDQSEKGKKRKRRYNTSEKGKASTRRFRQRKKEREAEALRLRREHEAEALRLRRQQQQQGQRRALVAKLRGFPAGAGGLPRAGAGSRSPFRYGLPRWYLPSRR